VSTRSSRTATVGTTAPAIELPQADGTMWRLADATRNGPVVLVFLRGFF
jgi:peroxiredoxin